MPIWIPSQYNNFFYSKSEVDSFIEEIDNQKADKVDNAVENNIVGLNIDGNILDTGFSLDDLIITDMTIDGGEF